MLFVMDAGVGDLSPYLRGGVGVDLGLHDFENHRHDVGHEAKDAVFWDRDLAGFGVRVHATGRKVYVVQSRGPGGPKRVTLARLFAEPSLRAFRRSSIPHFTRTRTLVA